MRRLALLLAVALLACWAAPTEAKSIFRDGRWHIVPDDEELSPRTDTHSTPRPVDPTSEKPQPPVTEEPNETPVTEEPGPVVPPVTKERTDVTPPDTDTAVDVAPSEPRRVVETPGPVEPLPLPTPADDGPPDVNITRVAPPELVVELPTVDPAPLEVPRTASVGEKYRNPEPSRAADEAQALLDASGLGEGDERNLLSTAIRRFREGRHSSAVSAASRFLKKFRTSRLAEAAEWLRIEGIFTGGDYYKACMAYEGFVKDYAGSRMVEKALLREFQCAEALLGPARRKLLGMPLLSGEDEALAILEKIYGHRPSGPLAADAIFRIAEYDIDHSKFEDAEQMLRKFLKEFPNHARARQAELLAAKCAMASTNGPVYDDTALRRAAETLKTYRNKYPEVASRENVSAALEKIRCQRAERMLETADYYRRAQRPKAARFYAQLLVKRYPGTPSAMQAQEMLARLPKSDMVKEPSP